MPTISRSKRLILWVITLALFLEALDVTIITTAIPQIAQSLNANPLDLKAALTSYLLSIAVLIPISSWAAERYGTKRVFITAMAVFALGSICCGFAINLPSLIVARIFQGMGGALMTPVARMVLARAFSKAELLKVTSYVTIPALIGPLLGPLVGGVLTHFLSWRWIFFVNIPFAGYGLYFSLRYFVDLRSRHTPKLDKLGFVLFAIASVGFTFTFEMLGEHYLPLPVVMFSLIVALAGLFAYWLYAKQRSQTLFDLSLFQIHTFKWSLLGNGWSRLGLGGINFILPLLFQLGLGYSPIHSGLLMVAFALGLLLMKFWVKGIIGRYGFRQILLFNTAGLAGCIFCFSLLSKTSAEIVLIGLLFTLGLLSSLHYSAMNTLVLADIPAKKSNQASVMLSTLQQLGSSFGVGICALWLGLFLKLSSNSAMANLAVYKYTFMVLGLMVLAAVGVFYPLSNQAGKAASGHNQ